MHRLIAMGLLWAAMISPGVANAQTEPVVLATGTFQGADSVHRGEGKALLVRLADGQRFLRFEQFRVTNGPDLYVYLSGHPAPRSSTQLHEAGAREVAVLKGNVGSQNYALPTDLDLAKFKSAVIYCKRFTVIFATAEFARN